MTDCTALKKFCSTLNAPDFDGLRVHLTGAHYTNDLKSKFVDEEKICPMCNNDLDSRAHRTLECCALSSHRRQWNQHTWEVAREDITAHFGLLHLPTECSKLRLLIPSVRVWCPEIPYTPQDKTLVIVFVDGTCFSHYLH